MADLVVTELPPSTLVLIACKASDAILLLLHAHVQRPLYGRRRFWRTHYPQSMCARRFRFAGSVTRAPLPVRRLVCAQVVSHSVFSRARRVWRARVPRESARWTSDCRHARNQPRATSCANRFLGCGRPSSGGETHESRVHGMAASPRVHVEKGPSIHTPTTAAGDEDTRFEVSFACLPQHHQ